MNEVPGRFPIAEAGDVFDCYQRLRRITENLPEQQVFAADLRRLAGVEIGCLTGRRGWRPRIAQTLRAKAEGGNTSPPARFGKRRKQEGERPNVLVSDGISAPRPLLDIVTA